MLYFKKAVLMLFGQIFTVSGACNTKILFMELIDLGLLLPFSIFNFIYLVAVAVTKKMNCLLCNFFVYATGEELFDHYVSYHKINPENYFFLNLFKEENGLVCKEWIRCQEFLTTKVEAKKHNFLKHYADGEEKPVEFKPIDITREGDITIYQISFQKHSDEYDFFDPEKIIREFLFNVKNLFKPSTAVLFKGDFAIENIQNAPIGIDNMTDIKSLRYWSTNVYKGIYLNDFIVAKIENDILKRVINNKLSGSLWHFNRFSYLNLKTVKESEKYKV